MRSGSLRLRALACAVLLAAGAAAGAAPAKARADLATAAVSEDARLVADWVVGSGDNRKRPFAIVDKKDARLLVFSEQGRLVGATPVLIGLATGDQGVRGMGALAPQSIPPSARTTPAGRFATEPGRNLDGESVVWFDYDEGLAIHRLRDDAARAARTKRLASADPRAHRVSAGCVVVPVEFYRSVVAAWLGQRRGVLYVLPETLPIGQVFDGLANDL